MKFNKIKVDGGFFAKNPLTGCWFVWIGDKRGADFICENKRNAILTAKAKGVLP
jgi:hypothetical protein